MGVYSILSYTKTKRFQPANPFGLAEDGSGRYLEGARNKLGSRGAVALRDLFFGFIVPPVLVSTLPQSSERFFQRS